MIEETMYLCKKDEFTDNKKILRKESHRAIIFKGDLLLMVYVNRYGDYRFPGGKLDAGETKEEGLKREVLEEVGAYITSITPFANIKTRNIERFKLEYDLFELDTYYYLCNIGDVFLEPNLDEKEIKDGFEMAWVSLDDAITQNAIAMKRTKKSLVIERETRMLHIIKEQATSNEVAF